MLVALVIVGLVLTYPALRAANWVPTDLLLEAASMVSTDRQGSLNVRLESEELELQRARQRIWFGWGSWGRNRVYDESGGFSPPTDGLWAIMISEFGIVGLVGLFGLLTAPVFLTAARFNRIPDFRDRTLTAGLVFLVMTAALDSIPNSTGQGVSLFLAGALAGIAEGAKNAQRPGRQPGATHNRSSKERSPAGFREPPARPLAHRGTAG